jgi:hypothetical protein
VTIVDTQTSTTSQNDIDSGGRTEFLVVFISSLDDPVSSAYDSLFRASLQG